jgi:DNA-binding response OmpR family regulator
MEFSLLLALLEEQGRVLSPVQAARYISGRVVSEAEAMQTIKVYIRRLRQKLEEAGYPPSVIVNVRGRGYMLDVAAEEQRQVGL